MAECLEDTSELDTDRSIDSRNFLREQFDIFKHDFREAFETHGHEKLANVSLTTQLKKDVVDTMRKLQRVKNILDRRTFKGEEDRHYMNDYLNRIKQVESELERVIRGKTEFTAKNVTLPEYDKDAISALFGPQEEADVKEDPAMAVIKSLTDFNEGYTLKVNEVIGAAQLIIREFDDIEEHMDAFSVPR